MTSSSRVSNSASTGDVWLFSPAWDLAAFLGSAAAAFLLLWIGYLSGVLLDDTPDWAWIPLILMIDVAHVYATGFRVYLDRDEFLRRPLLYSLVPAGGFLLGLAVYTEFGALWFWRILAYLAVFHFVRQQYGWVALYRAKLGERDRFGGLVDRATIYLATIYPLVYWHCHLPRDFWWFLPRDFASLPAGLATALMPFYWLAMSVYLVTSVGRWASGRGNPGKDIVVATTALCWYVGIITFNSDYAFTVTNVVIHGVPYMVLIYWYVRSRAISGGAERWRPWRTAVLFVSTIWLLAYAEELLWDRAIWRERGWFFGRSLDVGGGDSWLVPLLAVPQLTHYVLDGFIWRRRNNPHFSLTRSASPAPRGGSVTANPKPGRSAADTTSCTSSRS